MSAESASSLHASMDTLGRCRTGYTSCAAGVDDFACSSSDEILLQVFPSNLDDVSKDARTAGRDANESKYLSMDSKCMCFHGWRRSVGWAVPGASQNPTIGGAEMWKKEKSETLPVAFSVCGVCALECAS